MTTTLTFILIVVLSSLLIVNTRKLPSFINQCRADDPDLSQCFKNVIEDIRPRFLKGIPEMQIPQLDPFYVPEIVLDNGNGSSFALKAKFNEVYIRGVKDLAIQKFDIDLIKPSVKIYLSFPFLQVDSDYTMDGRLLVLQIKSHGKFQGNFTSVKGHVELAGTFNNRNGKRYVDWADRKELTLSIEKLNLHLTNLFENNPELTDSTNQVLNENSDTIIDEFKPLLEESIGTIFLDIFKRVFRLYSVNELFIFE